MNNNDNYKTASEELEEQFAKLREQINNKAAKYELLKEEYRLTGIVPEGMKQCPKCAELLFGDANYCPNCKDLLSNITINEQQRNPNNIIINNMSSSSSSASSSVSNSNINIRVRRKYNIIIDLFMICITGGLWLIWMLIRPKYY